MPVQGPPTQELQTVQVRNFKGVNHTDNRHAIDDDEFYWLENVMTVGKGQAVIVPGPGDTIATLAGFYPGAISPSMFPVNLASGPGFIIVSPGGAISHVTVPGGVVTVVAAAGTFTAAAHIAVWRDTTVLIIDPSAGYYQWTTGGGLAVIDATKKGNALAVFEGRAWLKTASRTIEFTAPLTFNDFVAANGAGSTIVTDEAFPGEIVALLSALEQLWIVGPGAIEAISNVQTAAGVTTFSITNIVGNVGTTYGASVSSFFRTFLFQTPYGVYAIVGATPQKLSDKLDFLYFLLVLNDRPNPSAVTTIFKVFTWVTLASYFDQRLNAERPLLLCFAKGMWFFASTPNLGYIASVLVGAEPQLWGIRKNGTGAELFQLFADTLEPVDYRIVTKLYDFGDSTQAKQMVRAGMEGVGLEAITPAILVENEQRAIGQPMTYSGIPGSITFVGVSPIIFTGSSAIVWQGVPNGLQLGRAAGQIIGRYLGFTLSGTQATWGFQAFIMEVAAAGKWQ